ncbi:hypothetical protein BJ170DRAFT_678444 [Xylariales sp. AK1849]|nr:hypothetical protein BJ170DRAFT_678444 [Xylariales sp. AK1849]
MSARSGSSVPDEDPLADDGVGSGNSEGPDNEAGGSSIQDAANDSDDQDQDSDDMPDDMPDSEDDEDDEVPVGGMQFPDERDERSLDDNDSDDLEGDNPDLSDADDDDDSSVGASILGDTDDESEANDYTSFESLKEKYVLRGKRIDELKREYSNRRDEYRIRIETLKSIGDGLRNDNRELENKIEKLESKLNGIREPPTPWCEYVTRYIQTRVPDLPENADEDDEAQGARQAALADDEAAWNVVHRASCKQGNMSQEYTIVHPDLCFNQERFSDQEMSILHQASLDAAANDNEKGEDQRKEPPFQFDDLPLDIQAKIFKHIFVKNGVVHALSRLDPFNGPRVPEQFPFPSAKTSGLPRRFVFGDRPCSITTAHKPRNILRPLLVSKRWLYIGTHAFYGMNTFAFSSLGEFGRFFKGIGQARTERVANIELMWHGSILPRDKTRVNQRTLPLLALTRMKRLQTLVVHLAESDPKGKSRMRGRYDMQGKKNDGGRDYTKGKSRMRRRYDMQDKKNDRDRDYTGVAIERLHAFQSLLKRTAIQPNFRGNRSMRTCHGMDYVYQLRGMKWIRFHDTNSGYRHRIRDWSFIDDINSVTSMDKDPRYKTESKIENLTDITGLGQDWDPSDADLQMVNDFYTPQAIESIVGGSETSASSAGPASPSNNSRSSTSDSDSGSDDGRHGSPSSDGGDAFLAFPDEADYDSGIEMDDDIPDYYKRDKGSEAGDSAVDVDDESHSSVDEHDDDDPFDKPDNPVQHSTGATNLSQLSIIDLTDGGDDDGDELESVGGSSSSGMFVPLNRDATRGTQSSRLSRRSTPNIVLSNNVIDLTGDDDGEEVPMTDDSTVNEFDPNNIDLESLFVRSDGGDRASTVFKSEGSGDEGKRRQVTIDLTQDDEIKEEQHSKTTYSVGTRSETRDSPEKPPDGNLKADPSGQNRQDAPMLDDDAPPDIPSLKSPKHDLDDEDKTSDRPDKRSRGVSEPMFDVDNPICPSA